ncbi:unnamed protein product [Didymodactylos carnosus]|uniref:Uncharacterized protein n=1 Tax=Didymodactylos carnosus TaxID=1234261 RepID=A0A815NC28_9BILA|nr:unnamed protein product [Didymodactylos carnosus]CAF4310418.1 unnamed protein product [Didymodactylos carnosus]
MSTWDGVVPGDGTVIIIPPGIIVYIDDARLIVNLLQIQIYGQLQIGELPCKKTPTSQQQSPQWQATQQDSRSHQAKDQNDENCVDEDEAIDINEDDKVFREIPSPSDPSDLN